MTSAINEARDMLDKYTDLASVRLMPSPGPFTATTETWAPLVKAVDTYGFTFQATLWQTWDCLCARGLTDRLLLFRVSWSPGLLSWERGKE
jgi:hypothetical protein